jgi:predicted phosphodiesterase
MSDNLPEKVQILGHAHIICITVREDIWGLTPGEVQDSKICDTRG